MKCIYKISNEDLQLIFSWQINDYDRDKLTNNEIFILNEITK